MIRFYEYAKCSTCRDAGKFLESHGVHFERIPIRETPPSKAELKKMLGAYHGEIRRLFNTSGMDYKAMGMKDRLPKLSEAEALELLSKNGNLIKRPFVLTEKGGIVGFREADWKTLFK